MKCKRKYVIMATVRIDTYRNVLCFSLAEACNPQRIQERVIHIHVLLQNFAMCFTPDVAQCRSNGTSEPIPN